LSYLREKKIIKKNYKKIICRDYRDLNKIIQKDMVLLEEGMKCLY